MRAADTVTIVAVGDIFLGDHPVTLNHGVNSMIKKRGCDYLFKKVSRYLRSGDIVCGNLEGIVSPKKPGEIGIEYEIFWGQPECAPSLQLAGFNCLFLANNHTAQHGKDALERTCSLLNSHNIKWTGFNADAPMMPIPAMFNIRGIKVAVLAYCETQQYHLDRLFLPRLDYDIIKTQVDNLKNECDIIILSLHWGDEFIDYPSPTQIDLAHSIIDMGVNIILGHHSHTVQGIEQYKHGLIAYSLGSFVKDLWPRKLRESIVLKCELSPQRVKRYEIWPVLINKQYQPEPYQREKGDKFLKRIAKLSDKLKVIGGTKYACKERYIREVNRLLLRDRVGTLLHYLTNIYKYDLVMLIKNVRMIIMRRVKGKNM
jgi:gamma-polyglutamate biosynthesis protein CapA